MGSCSSIGLSGLPCERGIIAFLTAWGCGEDKFFMSLPDTMGPWLHKRALNAQILFTSCLKWCFEPDEEISVSD